MRKRLLSLTMTLCMMASLMPNTAADAASKKKSKTSLNAKTVTLKVGQKKVLKLKKAEKLSKKKIKKVKWSSSNKRVATVKYKGKKRQQGTVTAVGAGTATIKVKYSGKTYKCKVTVSDPGKNKTTEKTTAERDTTEKATEHTTEAATEKRTEEVTTEHTTEATTEKRTEEATTEATTEITGVEALKAQYNPDNWSFSLEGVGETEHSYSYSKNEDPTYKGKCKFPSDRYSKFSFNVASPWTDNYGVIEKDGNSSSFGYLQSEKYYIYPDERMLQFQFNDSKMSADDVKITAIDLKTNKSVKYPLMSGVVAYKKTDNLHQFMFTQGYIYTVTLPKSCYGIVYQDTTFRFIVTDDVSQLGTVSSHADIYGKFGYFDYDKDVKMTGKGLWYTWSADATAGSSNSNITCSDTKVYKMYSKDGGSSDSGMFMNNAPDYYIIPVNRAVVYEEGTLYYHLTEPEEEHFDKLKDELASLNNYQYIKVIYEDSFGYEYTDLYKISVKEK